MSFQIKPSTMQSALTKVVCCFPRGSRWPSFKMPFPTHIFQKTHCLAADLSRIRRIGGAAELRFRDSAPAGSHKSAFKKCDGLSIFLPTQWKRIVRITKHGVRSADLSRGPGLNMNDERRAGWSERCFGARQVKISSTVPAACRQSPNGT